MLLKPKFKVKTKRESVQNVKSSTLNLHKSDHQVGITDLHITAESEVGDATKEGREEAIDSNLKEFAIKTEYEPKILKVVLKQKVISPDLSPRTQRSNDDYASYKFRIWIRKKRKNLH